MCELPAPDYADFDVASDEDYARREYANCKQIWRAALALAIRGDNDAPHQVLIAKEYFRAAEQIRYQYQLHYRKTIDDQDKLIEWSEPTLTPSGAIVPTFETTEDIERKLYEWLKLKYPHLLPHWRRE